MVRLTRLVAIWTIWWIVLLAFWLLLVGTKDELETLAGACAAAIGATAAEAVRSQDLLRFRFKLGWLSAVAMPLARIGPDFAILTLALVRALVGGDRRPGRFRAIPFESGGNTALGAGRRAFVTLAGSLAPNSLVVDVDRERNLLLVHDLDPKRAGAPSL